MHPYTIPIKIKNPPIDTYHTYDVKNGSFEILLESPTARKHTGKSQCYKYYNQ
ncbi:MAG TPA: hypothetical protein VK469_16190 [Candidatus Kapabacteria bacterium]|nr:hypothetical protein [Candidatus Kapabacteria bacterium]